MNVRQQIAELERLAIALSRVADDEPPLHPTNLAACSIAFDTFAKTHEPDAAAVAQFNESMAALEKQQ